MMLPPLISTATFLVLAIIVVWMAEMRKRREPEACGQSWIAAFLDRPKHSSQPATAPAGVESSMLPTSKEASVSSSVPTSKESSVSSGAASRGGGAMAELLEDDGTVYFGVGVQTWIDVRDMSVCAFGVIGVFLLYGVYQERVMTEVYYNDDYPDGERFTWANCITFLNRAFSIVFALVLLWGKYALKHFQGGASSEAEQWDKRASYWEYAIGGFTNTISSVCQYASIHFISFPVLVLSKACKMPTTMLANFMCFGRSYGLFEWMAALVVLMGSLLFLLYDADAANKHDSHLLENNIGGIVLVVIFLATDAYTSTWQAATFGKDTAILPMMLLLSLWSCVFSATGFIFSSEASASMGFFRRNPLFVEQAIVLSITSAVGQLFILITIKRFGPLAFAALATVRQILSAIISIITFHHTVHMLQLVGLSLTFAALGAVVRFKLHHRAVRIAKAKHDAALAKKTDAPSADSEAGAKGGAKGNLALPEAALARPAGLEEGLISPNGTDSTLVAESSHFMRLSAVWLSALLVVLVFVSKSILTLVMLKKTQEHDEHGAVKTTGVAYSAVSSATTILWLMLLFTAKPTCFQPVEVSMWAIFAVVCVLSVLDLGLTNVAISILDPTLQQCLAALSPVFTFIVESLLALELKHPLICFFVIVVATGACASAFTKLHQNSEDSDIGSEVNGMLFQGVLAMVGASLASGCKLVLLRATALRSRISPVSMLFWCDTLVFLVLTPLSIALGEMLTLVDAVLAGPALLSVGVAFTGGLGGVRFLSELYALQYMNAVDLSIVNTFAAMIYVILCFWLFPHDVRHSGVVQWTAMYITSVAVTFSGLVGYVVSVRHFYPDHIVYLTCGKGILQNDEMPCGKGGDDASEACKDNEDASSRDCCCGQLLAPR